MDDHNQGIFPKIAALCSNFQKRALITRQQFALFKDKQIDGYNSNDPKFPSDLKCLNKIYQKYQKYHMR